MKRLINNHYACTSKIYLGKFPFCIFRLTFKLSSENVGGESCKNFKFEFMSSQSEQTHQFTM